MTDEYLTQQAKALVEAVRNEASEGDGTRSFQLAEHLAAEGGVHRGDILTATSVLLSIAAWCDGAPDAAAEFARRAHDHGVDSRELVFHLLSLEAGWEQGWLPTSEHEALIAYARRADRPDIETRLRAIERRD